MKPSFVGAAVLLVSSTFCAAEVRQDASHVVLSNRRVRVVLDRDRKGAVGSLVDIRTGLEFADRRTDANLFMLTYTKPGDRTGKVQWLLSSQADSFAVSLRARRATLTYGRLAGLNVSVVCTADVLEDEVRWRLSVRGPAAVVLETVLFPVVELRAPLAGDGVGDAFVAGLTKGGVLHNPSKWGKNRAIHARQPGQLAAQFGCYYSVKAGLYSATRDPRGYPKTLEFRRTKAGLRWAWQRHAFHHLDRPFELGYDVALTTFGPQAPGEPADWRDAADIYKAWALKQPWCATRFADRADIPAWLKSGPAMIRFSRSWLAEPARVRAWLTDYWRKHFPRAPLIVALWGWEHVGSWVSPKYFPPFPSEEGFASVVKAARAVDGHPFPWPSGYYWNVEYGKRADGSFESDDWADFNRTGKPHVLITRKGEPLVRKLRWLHGGRNAALCRGDAWTRQWFNANCVELMKRGCDMVQVDQVVGGAAPGRGECFATTHGHPPGPGLWDTEAFADQLRSLAVACRREQPDAVLSIEEPQELFNHLIGIQDYRDFQTRRWPKLSGLVQTSVFGYLYHEFLPVFQSNPRRGDRLGMAYCIATGQVPHWVPHWPVAPAPMPAGGDFDEWVGDAPAGWQKVKGWQGKAYSGRCARDEAVRHGGLASLRLENTQEGEIVQVSRNVPIGPRSLEPGRRYRATLWAKTETLAQPNSVGMSALTGDLKSRGSWRLELPKPGDWTRVQVELTPPSSAHFLRIMIHVTGPCRLWVDDLAFEEQVDGQWRPARTAGVPVEHDLARQWVELFHGAGRPYLLLGRMLHPPKLLAPTEVNDSHKPFPPILLNAFGAPDGSEAAVAVNVTGKTQDVRFRWRGRAWNRKMAPWTVQLIRDDGHL